MTEPENIQCFNAAARAVLSLLYANFPKPMAIDAACLLDGLPEYCRKEWGPFHGSDNVVAATVRFLRDEGYLRHGGEANDRQTLFPGAVLTSRGFLALQKPVPMVNDAGTSLGKRLSENLSISDLSVLMTGLFQAGSALLK
jgi:hypothetical protein